MPSRDPKDLHESIRAKAIACIKQMDAAVKIINPEMEVKLICTYRSNKEQAELYAQGRTKAGQKVTTLKGNGAHNTDLPETPHGDSEAFDIGVFKKGLYLSGKTAAEVQFYIDMGAIGKAYGFEWGGDWVKFKDYPHYQRKDWADLK